MITNEDYAGLLEEAYPHLLSSPKIQMTVSLTGESKNNITISLLPNEGDNVSTKDVKAFLEKMQIKNISLDDESSTLSLPLNEANKQAIQAIAVKVQNPIVASLAQRAIETVGSHVVALGHLAPASTSQFEAALDKALQEMLKPKAQVGAVGSVEPSEHSLGQGAAR